MSEVVVEALVDVGMESSGAHDLLLEPDHNLKIRSSRLWWPHVWYM